MLLPLELLLDPHPFLTGETAEDLVTLKAAHVEHGEGDILVRGAHESVLHLDLIREPYQIEEAMMSFDPSHAPTILKNRLSDRENLHHRRMGKG